MPDPLTHCHRCPKIGIKNERKHSAKTLALASTESAFAAGIVSNASILQTAA